LGFWGWSGPAKNLPEKKIFLISYTIMLSDEDKSNIKAQIESQIAQLNIDIPRLADQAKPVAPDRAIGRITRMDAIQQKHMAESRLRYANEVLHGLNEALKCLDEPSFGECILCNKPIPVERILALPHTKKCVNCA